MSLHSRNISVSKPAAGGATREEDVQTARAELKATQARIDMFQAQIRQAEASLRSDRRATRAFTRQWPAPWSPSMHAKARPTLSNRRH